MVAESLELVPSRIVTLTIAGTNGKGSSASLAALIYREAGYRVGLYTSPHLLRYNERVQIDGVEASDADLVAAFTAIEAARGEIGLTYFEFGTLAALWLFRRAAIPVQVLEVGLGGRLDAVNLVDADCAMVTNIGLDHLDWLGPDRDSIATEKAGVFRAGRPAVSVDPDPPRSLAERARAIGAQYRAIGRAFDFEPATNAWHWWSTTRQLRDLPFPGLDGVAQLRNAAGVLAAVEALSERLPVTEAQLRSALPKLRLAGRFQVEGRWIFDVAHNAESAQVLADNLRALAPPERMRVVIGLLSDKPVEQVLGLLAPCASRFEFVSLPPPRGLPASELIERSRHLQVVANAHADVDSAVRQCRLDDEPDTYVVFCGSFVTVGLAMQALAPDISRPA